ncbi:SAM-dependent DNA methyltransferase [candidate division KSB1 bacterium]|nr:SAM-dependent DNA methyltransferase [candidate division KSB1 bacterium]
MNPKLRRKLDQITDILWAGGVTNPVTYIEQISYLIYLKMLDEEENERELRARLTGNTGIRLFPGQAEEYRWQNWRFKSGTQLRDFVRDDVFPYMANSLIKDAPQVSEYFRDAVLEITDPNVLKEVIDELDEINFRRLGPDEKGDIFEYLLTHLGQSALNGQFRTPRQIRALMVEMVEPDLGETIYDPACGTAGFLIDCVEYILARYSEDVIEIPIYGEEWLWEKYIKAHPELKEKLDNNGNTVVPKEFIEKLKAKIPNLQTYRKGKGEKIPDWNILERSIFGIDVSRQIMRIATMNMVLHGVPHAKIKRANTLSELGGLTEEDLRRKYKVILSNPPFAGVIPKESIRKDLPTSSKKSELLFLALMMEALTPGGRCAVVVPEGLLFGSTKAHIELRRKLINEFQLLAVISLPAGVFKPYAGVKTGILVFKRPQSNHNQKSSSKNYKVWFFEVQNDGFDPDKIVGGGRPETPKKNNIPDLLSQWRIYKKSGFKEPPGEPANTLLEPESEAPRCWWADTELIAGYDFNLAAGRYKPQVGEKPPEEEPRELINKLFSVESDILNSLKKLLLEIE